MAFSEQIARILVKNIRTEDEVADLAEFLEFCTADEWEEYLVLSGEARAIELDSATREER